MMRNKQMSFDTYSFSCMILIFFQILLNSYILTTKLIHRILKVSY